MPFRFSVKSNSFEKRLNKNLLKCDFIQIFSKVSEFQSSSKISFFWQRNLSPPSVDLNDTWPQYSPGSLLTSLPSYFISKIIQKKLFYFTCPIQVLSLNHCNKFIYTQSVRNWHSVFILQNSNSKHQNNLFITRNIKFFLQFLPFFAQQNRPLNNTSPYSFRL